MPAKKWIGIELNLNNPEQTSNEVTTPTQETKPSIDLIKDAGSTKTIDYSEQILERLQRLEEENRSLKESQDELKSNNFSEVLKKRREKYTWPHKYSFKTFEGKPIISLKTTSNKVSRDYVKGGYIVDQKVELTFADNSKTVVTYDDFSQNYQRSEKIFVEEEVTRGWKRYYKFNIDWNTFEVDWNIIN